jgi:hypothetical protein
MHLKKFVKRKRKRKEKLKGQVQIKGAPTS